MMTLLDKIDDLLGRLLLVLSGAAVLALMLLATGNVVLRIFHIPFRGTYEIVSFLGAIGIAFALASTQRRKGHIVVDILSSRYSRPVRRFVDALSAAISSLFFRDRGLAGLSVGDADRGLRRGVGDAEGDLLPLRLLRRRRVSVCWPHLPSGHPPDTSGRMRRRQL